jgi:perosamine synthetase
MQEGDDIILAATGAVRLARWGISTRRAVMASHLEPSYKDLGYHLPATQRAADECLQLPMHAGMSEADADAVLAAIAKAYRLA